MRNYLSIMLLLLLGANTHVFAEKQDTIIGKASYYSDKLHGRTMSNGRPYHRDSMTCAHLKFPFGTMLKVKNPINDKEVIGQQSPCITTAEPTCLKPVLGNKRSHHNERPTVKSSSSSPQLEKACMKE